MHFCPIFQETVESQEVKAQEIDVESYYSYYIVVYKNTQTLINLLRKPVLSKKKKSLRIIKKSTLVVIFFNNTLLY